MTALVSRARAETTQFRARRFYCLPDESRTSGRWRYVDYKFGIDAVVGEAAAMKPYANLDGDSGVAAYSIRPDGIVVKFKSDGSYEYTDASAGPDAIATMQRLARSGRGLSTFISQHKPPYVRKL